jgi:hypothetical protein
MITLAANSEEALEAIATEFLEKRGRLVTIWKPWERTCDLCARLSISQPTFKRRILSPACPPIGLDKDKHGKIMLVSSNEFADRFLISGKI